MPCMCSISKRIQIPRCFSFVTEKCQPRFDYWKALNSFFPLFPWILDPKLNIKMKEKINLRKI